MHDSLYHIHARDQAKLLPSWHCGTHWTTSRANDRVEDGRFAILHNQADSRVKRGSACCVSLLQPFGVLGLAGLGDLIEGDVEVAGDPLQLVKSRVSSAGMPKE